MVKKSNSRKRAIKPAIAAKPRRIFRLLPKDVRESYNISDPTRWRWEKCGKLPPRDFFVGGVAVGWKPETIEAAMNGEMKAV